MLNKIDWKAQRQLFPACENSVYLLTASEAPLSLPVLEARTSLLKDTLNHGGLNWPHYLEMVENTRSKVAQLLGVKEACVGFGPNTGYNMNLLALLLKKKGVGNVVVPKPEFSASTLPWLAHGFEVREVPSRGTRFLVDDFLAQVDAETKAVIVSHVQSFTGFRQDLIALGKGLKEKGVPFIVNATQSLGVYPAPIQEAHISALTCTCHKWVGAGFGIGLLYVDESLHPKDHWPFLGWLSPVDPWQHDLTNMSFKTSVNAIEIGTLPFEAFFGLNAACDQILSLGQEAIAQRVLSLSNKLCESLDSAGFEILSTRDPQSMEWDKSANSSIVLVKVANPEELVEQLKAKGIYTSARGGGLRLSLHYYNNEEDIARLMEELVGAISGGIC